MAPAPWAGRVQQQLHNASFQLQSSDEDRWFLHEERGLRAHFDELGATITPKGSQTWSFTVRTAALGRQVTTPVTPGRVGQDVCASPQVDPLGSCLRRASRVLTDDITEWWANGPAGLQQGWTVHRPVPGTGPLQIDVAFDGATATLASQTAAVLRAGSYNLRYGGLTAFDADGVALPATFLPRDGGLRIEVEVADARYPVTVDPVIGQATWVVDHPEHFGKFGLVTTTAGDVNGDGYDDALVSAPALVGGGRVFAYYGGPDGPTGADWAYGSGSSPDAFGVCASSAGDINGDGYDDVIAGNPVAYGDPGYGELSVFFGSAAGLDMSPDQVFGDATLGKGFGNACAAAGDVDNDGYDDVIVGNSVFEDGQTVEGAAFLFRGTATGLEATPSWEVQGDQGYLALGHVVASAGDVNNDGFDDLLVGSKDLQQPSSIWLFLGSAAGPSSSPDWEAHSDGEARIGHADVNGDGFSDVLVSTAQTEAAIHLGGAAGPSTLPDWQTDAGGTIRGVGDLNNDGYDEVAIGFNTLDLNVENVASVFFGGPAGPGEAPNWLSLEYYSENQSWDFPITGGLDGAGDMNGDGFDDLLLGDPSNISGSKPQVSLHLGGVTGPRGASVFDVSQATNELPSFGGEIAPAGDVDGDGYPDLLVASPTLDTSEFNAGAAFLYRGGPDGMEPFASWSIYGTEDRGELGLSMHAAGDVNNDGYDDVVIGEPGGDDRGRALVFQGSSTGLSPTADLSLALGTIGSAFGSAVAGGGDIDGDGFDDIAVGAPQHAGPEIDEGKVWLFRGSAAGIDPLPAWSYEVDRVANVGTDLSLDGDVNGDGFADLLVGAETDDSLRGAVAAFYGDPAGLPAQPSWQHLGSNNDQLGIQARHVGDVNNDGFGDAMLSSRGDGATLFLGSAAGLDPAPAWAANPSSTVVFGWRVRPAHDVNGDGFDDVVISDILGNVLLFDGDANGLSTPPSWANTFDSFDYGFGIGDINFDGYADLAIGGNLVLSVLYGSDDDTPKVLRADAGGPYLSGVDTPIALDGSNTQALPPSWLEWDCEDDGIIDVAGPSAACDYPAPGFYTLRLHVTDAGGQVDEDTAEVEIIEGLPSGTLADATADEGATVTLQGTAEDDDPLTYRGDCGDGLGLQPVAAPSFDCTYADDGNFTASLEVSDGTFVVTVQADVTVVNVAPTLSAEVPDGFEGTPLGFDWLVDEPGDDTVEVSWDCDAFDGLDFSGIGQTLTCTYDNEGTYEITGLAIDDDGGESQHVVTATIANVAPDVNAGPDQQVQVGELVTVAASYSDPGRTDDHTVHWDFGDGATSEDTSAAHSYAAAGSYEVTLTVTDSGGAVGSDTVLIDVMALQTTPDTSPTATTTGEPPAESTDEPKEESDGCGCASASPSGLWLALPLLGLRRRQG